MAGEILDHDGNNYRVAGAVSDTVSQDIKNIRSDSNGYLQCEAVGVVNDYKVGVTINDTTPDYLSSKLVQGTGINLTVQNPGANENILIEATAPAGGLQVAYITVPSANVKTLFSVPVTLLAAPGVTEYYSVLNIHFSIPNGSTPYDAAFLFVKQGGGSLFLDDNTLQNPTGEPYSAGLQGATILTKLGTPVYLTANVDSTLGSGDLTVAIVYTLLEA